jgi:hypothetical protein
MRRSLLGIFIVQGDPVIDFGPKFIDVELPLLEPGS